MIVKPSIKPCLILGIAALFCAAHSTAVSEDGESPTQEHQVMSGLETSVHASIVEAPFGTNVTNGIKEDAGFFGKIRRQFGSFFGHKSRNKTDATDEGTGKNNGTLATGTPSAEQNSTEDSVEGPSPEISPTSPSEPLKPSSTDAVTTRMRLTSFLESISASLEDMRMLLSRALWASHHNPYEIVSLNDTMLIAAVSGRRFYAPEGKQRVVPVRAVFHNQKLSVEVEESSFIEHADNSSKVSEETAGIGTEYQFNIKSAHAIVEDIYLRPTQGPIPGYEIIVPLRKESSPNGNAEAISRTVAKAMSPGNWSGEVVEGHWGTMREEDEYEFLQAQMGCQKLHGASGIRRMLCTCEKVHGENLTRRLLCVSRIADKVVTVAKDHGEGRMAAKIYRGSIRCRNARYGVKGSHDCLVKLLEERAGAKSDMDVKHGRNILGKKAESSSKVDELLSKEKMEVGDVTKFDSGEMTVGGGWSVGKSGLHALTFVLYVVGIGFLVVCVLDLGQQYRRHRSENRCDGQLSRLPAHAQALYARLTMRS